MQSIEETKPKRQDWWRHHLPELLLAIAIIIFIGGIGFLASLRQANFLSSRFDLGLMDQVVWNTAHGRLLQLTDPDGVATISRLTIHADIFLALLAPLYWIYSSPYTLIALQTVILALGALPLYRLGCLVLKNRPLALTIAISYLAFPLMQRADLFDFHAVTLSTTFLLFAFYYAYTKQYWRFGLLSVLTMTTKETMPFLIIMLGIYILWTKRNRWVGLGTILISAAWFYVLLWWVMPGARGGSTHFALSYYSQFGATPIQIITTLVIKPWTWIRDLLTFKTYSYLHYFVLPTFLFSLFSPLIILLAIPELLLNLLSNDPAMHTIYFQYTSAITPYFFIAAIFGLARVRNWLIKLLSHFRLSLRSDYLTATLILLIATSGIGCEWLWSPLPGTRTGGTLQLQPGFPGIAYLNQLAVSIPQNASVSATAKIEPHFSEREHIYPFPQGIGLADYILVEVGDPGEILSQPQIIQAVDDLSHNPAYRQIYRNGPVSVFKRR